jgi:hypothetical protein
MRDLIVPPGGFPVDAGMGEGGAPSRQPEVGCAASQAWLLPLVLSLVALATRAALRRPLFSARRARRLQTE